MSEEKKKPVNPPQNWWVKARVIDETGEVFEFGQYKGHKDVLGIDENSPLPEKPKKEVTEEIKPEVKSEPKPKVESNSNQEVIKEKVSEIKSEPKPKVESNSNQELVQQLLDIIKSSNTSNGLTKEDVIRAIEEQKAGKKIHKGLDTIDKNDILDPPVMITARAYMYLMYDYLAPNGEVTVNPTGEPIVLKPKGNVKYKTDREEQRRCLCGVQIKSKKVLEWVRNAPYYKITVFENSNDAMKSNPTIMQEMARQWQSIDSMDTAELVKKAESLHIPAIDGMDKADLKREIALKLSDQMEADRQKLALEKARIGSIANLTS